MSLPDPNRAAHRPWPAPRRPWAVAMRWHDLAFLHWPVPVDALRPHVPPGLALDAFDGSAWIGIVPFRMSGVRPRLVPALPGISAFPELNLRTYVSVGGKPGVWFFSLDVTRRVAVVAARALFHLPYHLARMSVVRRGDEVRYASERSSPRGARGFAGRYRPLGPVFRSEPGSIDAWLTERYCLYAADRRGRLHRGEVHHEPWPLQRAEVEIERDTLSADLGLRYGPRPLVHFARRLDVVAWALRPAE